MKQFEDWRGFLEVENSRKGLRGKSLPETGYDLRYVNIYRAKGDDNIPGFKEGDFVTRSRKFAKGHADHNVVTQEETQVVVKEMVRAEHVYEAPNPGEFLYFGPDVKGKIIYRAKVDAMNEEEPYQQHQQAVHPKRKERLLSKGGNKTFTYPGKPDKRRGKSSPPGFGGSNLEETV